MRKKRKNCFLGVDIGASKSHALIADENGKAIGFGKGGPGNHEVVGYNGLSAVLEQITQDALAMANIEKEQVAGAGFGVAGYDWPGERQDTLQAIGTLGLQSPVEAVNDTIIGLLAGTSAGWGVATVAGTGTNCWGWDLKRNTGRVTGMGWLFGEVGGGGDVVAAAVRAIAYEWAGRGPQTALTTVFLKHTGAHDTLDFLEGLTLGRIHLGARMAPLVFEVARQGDQAAIEAIRWVGQQLGEMTVGVIHQLKFEDLSFEIVMVGSLYDGGPLIIDPMKETVLKTAPKAKLVRLGAPPVVGGVLLGIEQAGLPASSYRQALIESTKEILGK